MRFQCISVVVLVVLLALRESAGQCVVIALYAGEPLPNHFFGSSVGGGGDWIVIRVWGVD
jgi:hypothetical protein